MASPNVVTLTADNFNSEVVSSAAPVLVDFWAEWCGPCKMIAPVLDELATEYAGKVRIGKVNIDEGSNQQLAVDFRVTSIPMFLLFKGGKPIGQKMGISGGKKALQEFINTAL
ncbi:MAG: hypothetical protein RLZZ350_189 [Verrucomicrobiota bacterium]|jgi:thioredoxin 1